MLMQATPSADPLKFLETLNALLPLIGWSAVILLVWRVASYFTSTAAKAEAFADKLVNNHLSHIESGIKTMCEGQVEMSKLLLTMQTLSEAHQNEQIRVLEDVRDEIRSRN